MISDEILCLATAEYEGAWLSSLPNAVDCQHTFSRKFEKKMRHLCHKVKYESTYTVLKRIACAVIVIALCTSMLLMLNTDVRAAVVGWIKETYNSFVGYSYVDQPEEEEKEETPVPQAYDFEKVPKGYTLLMRQETLAGDIVIYQNADGNIMQLGCYTKESGVLFVGGYEYDHSRVVISGKTADLYIAKDPTHSNTIVWENAEGNILFQLTAYLGKDSLIQLAHSVSPIHGER